MTRIVNLLGAALPATLLPPGHGNDTGFWEPLPLVSLNDRLLREAGSSWDDWRPRDPLAELPPARLAAYESEVAAVIAEEYGDAPLLVLKDPRICRLVPLYHAALRRLGIRPVDLLVHRNPAAVAASLFRRDRVDPDYTALLWLRHTLDAERHTRGAARSILPIDELFDDWRAAVDQVAAQLGLQWPTEPHTIAAAVAGFLDPARLQSPPSGPTYAASPLLAAAEALSDALTNLPDDHRRALALDQMAAELRRASATLDGVIREVRRRSVGNPLVVALGGDYRAPEHQADRDALARQMQLSTALKTRVETLQQAELLAQQAAQERQQLVDALQAEATQLRAEAATFGARLGRLMTRMRRRYLPNGTRRARLVLGIADRLEWLYRRSHRTPGQQQPH